MTKSKKTITFSKAGKAILVIICLILFLSAVSLALPDKWVPDSIKPVRNILSSVWPFLLGATFLFIGWVLLPVVPVAGVIFLIIGAILVTVGVTQIVQGTNKM